MNITPHFSLEEFTYSDTATRLSIDQTPSAESMANLLITAQGMEKVRDILEHPIRIHSGYRSPALNRVINGAANSAHCSGFAADFTCPGFGSPLSICRAIGQTNIDFDQLIYEGTWVHISFKPPLRRSVMTARFSPGKPTLYTNGLP